MTWRIIGPERNMPPPEFQDRLTELGGVNRYSEPNFVVWWGQYAHGEGSFIAGGSWSVDEASYTGYRRLLRGSGEPCWCLGQWHSPEEYGTPERYYIDNFDDATGLSILGPYAYSGRYELLFNLRWHERVGNRMEFRSMPLTSRIFDLVIPILVAAQGISAERRKQAYIESRRQDEEAKLLDVERHLRAQAIPFTGAVSYTRQGIRSTLIDQKMIALQRSISQVTDFQRQLLSRPGLQVR